MGKMYSIEEQTLTDIINVPREILNIDSEQKFPPSEFPSMINNAVSYVAESVGNTAYQGGLEEGYNNGYAEGTKNGFEIGKQQAYDEFWDKYQNEGKRTSYQYAFAGEGWNDDTFKPKYNIVLGYGYTGTNTFWGTQIKNIKASLEAAGVILDTSQCRSIGFIFQSTVSRDLPKIDLSNADYNTNYCFASPSILTIDEVVFSEKTLISSSTFANATNLQNVTFSGVAVGSIDMHWSTSLAKESIVSVVGVLSATASGQTLTLSKVAVNKAFETSAGANDGSTSTEWATLVATKTNWTISLV